MSLVCGIKSNALAKSRYMMSQEVFGCKLIYEKWDVESGKIYVLQSHAEHQLLDGAPLNSWSYDCEWFVLQFCR